MQSWSPLTFDTDSNQKDSYLSTLTAFLAANPPGTLGNMTGVSSPEASDESSPSSSEGNNSSGTPANNSTTSITGAAAGDKRKQTSSSSVDLAAPLKDRRSNSATDHSHPQDDEDDDQDQDEEPGKKGKTSEKRRAQNRQAQRAFRERKEKHLKELEDRVLSLEQKTTEKDSENSALKQLVERLQNENERLKVYESAFSFSYAKDVSNSASMPTAPQFGGPKAVTPPIEEIPDLSTFGLSQFGVSGGLQSLTSAALTSAALNSTSNSTNAFASPAFSFPQVSAPASTTASGPPSTVGSGFDNSLFFGSISAPSPASTTGDSTSGSSLNVSTPPDLSSDLFSAYRDPSSNTNLGLGNNVDVNGFPDFESLFGPSATTGLDENPLASFLASPSPPALSKSPQNVAQTQSAVPSPPSLPAASSAASTTSPLAHQVMGTCPLTNGEKFSFDVDGLCSELQAKAVCREAAKAALQAAMTEDAKVVQELYGNKTK